MCACPAASFPLTVGKYANGRWRSARLSAPSSFTTCGSGYCETGAMDFRGTSSIRQIR